MNLGLYILILGLLLLLIGEVKQFLNYFDQISRFPDQIEGPKDLNGLYLKVYKHIAIIAIISIILISIILTLIVFKIFPTTLEAHKVIGVFAGITGSICALIGTHKILTASAGKRTGT